MADAAGPVRFYTFERMCIDVQRRLLLRDGRLVAIKPKALETLLVLIEHRDRVVEKDELMNLLWPDTAVEEANLTQNVFVIRKALGETPGDQRFIATVARRGYRFVAEVQETRAAEAARLKEDGGSMGGDPARGQWIRSVLRPAKAAAAALLLALAGALLPWDRWSAGDAAAPIHAVAVLPFQNMSADPGQEYFADGITDAVITDLASISALRVVSRQSVRRFRHSREPLAAIARQLGVDALVQGTVVRSGGRVRLTAQLVDGRSDTHLWAGSFDRPLGDLLGLQGELARAVASAVRVTLKEHERAALVSRRAVDPEAYDLYLRARHLFGQRSEQALRKSLEYYQRAIDRDPLFAQAHAGLALTFIPLGYYYEPPGENRARIRAAAEQALELDPGLADAHIALAAWTVIHQWDWEGGERAWKRILERTPNDATAHQWYGFLLECLGRLDEALTERRLAAALAPLSPSQSTSLADVLRLRNDPAGAIRGYERTLELDGTFFRARMGLGWTYMQQGELAEGLAELEEAVSVSGDDPFASAWLGHAYGIAGRQVDARRILEALARRARAQYVPPVFMAQVHAGLGEHDAAIARLEQAYRQRSPALVQTLIDPLLAPLADDPRFADLLRRMNLPLR